MHSDDLQEISPNVWKAKYHGNYGIYTIKIKTNGGKTVDFSCTCPSDYYPCKHIRMIEQDIKERIAKSKKFDEKKGITLTELLNDVPQNRLRDFIIRQAQNNPQLKNTVFLEFDDLIKKKDASAYSYNQLIQEALDAFDCEEMYWEDDYENSGYYSDYELDIEALNEWFDKAQEYADKNNFQEAISICKACIEEFATWYERQNFETYVSYCEVDYRERPFEILSQILTIPEVNHTELLGYCKTEMVKPKYKKAEMYSGFQDLLMELSVLLKTNDFIDLQDKMLGDIYGKDSDETKEILQRKIDFFRNNDQPDEAWNIIKTNLQIKSFKEEWVKKLISEKDYKEAKNLIKEFLTEEIGWKNESWYVLKLQIARAENDVKEIRCIALQFIENDFNDNHYKIYKSTFTEEEWPEQMEKLILRYEKLWKSRYSFFGKVRFIPSVAKILKTEKQGERLMNYIEKDLSAEVLERYYIEFSSQFPEKTLMLFRQAINQYADQNVGDKHYDYVVNLVRKMLQIVGGKEVVIEMITEYRTLYKKRKNMIGAIDQFVAQLN